MIKIHFLPTEKHTYIYKDIKGKIYFNKDYYKLPFGRINQEIYITYDKKIILTTNKKLIKNDVKAINDYLIKLILNGI